MPMYEDLIIYDDKSTLCMNVYKDFIFTSLDIKTSKLLKSSKDEQSTSTQIDIHRQIHKSISRCAYKFPPTTVHNLLILKNNN